MKLELLYLKVRLKIRGAQLLVILILSLKKENSG
jgi:hypothetical protein